MSNAAVIPLRTASFRVPRLPLRQPQSREAWCGHIAASCVKYRKGRSVIGPVRVELTHGVKRPAMHYGAHGVFPKSPAYPTNGHSALDLMEDALDGIVAGGLISSKQSVVDLQIRRVYVDTDGKTGLHVKVIGLATRVASLPRNAAA